MIYYIILTWILIAFCDLPLVLFVVWRMRSVWTRQGAKYIVIALIGSAVNDVITLFLAMNTLPHVRADQVVSTGTILFTFGNITQTLPTIALALYLLGLFSSEKTKEERL